MMGEFFGFGEDLEHKHPPKPQTDQLGDQKAKSPRQPQFCRGDLLSIGLKVSLSHWSHLLVLTKPSST
jgi:hypothetical protein